MKSKMSQQKFYRLPPQKIIFTLLPNQLLCITAELSGYFQISCAVLCFAVAVRHLLRPVRHFRRALDPVYTSMEKFLNGQKPARLHLSLTHRPAVPCKFLNGQAASCKRVVDRKINSSFKTFSGPGSSACSALNRIDLEALCAAFKKYYVLKIQDSIFIIDNITAQEIDQLCNASNSPGLSYSCTRNRGLLHVRSIVCVIDKKAMGEDNSYFNVKQKYASQLLGTLRYSGRGRGGLQLELKCSFRN